MGEDERKLLLGALYIGSINTKPFNLKKLKAIGEMFDVKAETRPDSSLTQHICVDFFKSETRTRIDKLYGNLVQGYN